jgi:hypothetical protein
MGQTVVMVGRRSIGILMASVACALDGVGCSSSGASGSVQANDLPEAGSSGVFAAADTDGFVILRAVVGSEGERMIEYGPKGSSDVRWKVRSMSWPEVTGIDDIEDAIVRVHGHAARRGPLGRGGADAGEFIAWQERPGLGILIEVGPEPGVDLMAVAESTREISDAAFAMLVAETGVSTAATIPFLTCSSVNGAGWSDAPGTAGATTAEDALASVPGRLASMSSSITLPARESTRYSDGPDHVVFTYSSSGSMVARISITKSSSGWFVDCVESCG